MRILVTGGAGYIGSVLVPELLKAGNEVTVLDNLVHGHSSLLAVAHLPTFDFVRGDARDRRLLSKLVPQHDVLIPLAAVVGAPAGDRDPRLTQELNVGAIETLLELRSSQQRVLYPNSNSGYGSRPGETCTEASDFAPVSLYGRTKVEAEERVLEAGNSVTFRLATAFGAGPRPRFDLLVNDFVYQAVHQRVLVLFESGFRRNFLHVRDIAGAFLFAIEHFDEMAGQTFNAGLSSANLTKLELAQCIGKHVDGLTILESEIGSDPDRRDYLVSNEKLEALGWRPQYSLDDGIRELIKACKMLPVSVLRNA